MSRSVEHIVEMHQIATERREAGQPIWDRKIMLGDIFRNEELTFEQRRDQIVARIRMSGWLKDRDDTLTEYVEDLAQSEDADEFDQWWDLIYDHADYDRVWIDTVSVPKASDA